MSGPALEVVSLGKSYRTGLRKPPRQALSGLTFTLPEGAVMGLLGPNGAGKTTTLKVIMDFLTPDSGEVRIFGRSWKDAEARRQVGFLPEQPYFQYYLTPRSLLRYLGRLLYMRREETEARITHLLNLVGLGAEADLQLSRFSRGMLQRLGIAQALLNQPRLLVLDEPSGGLDPLGMVEVRKLLQDVRDGGTTILFSSHQLSEVEEICDHLCIIDRGREVAQGSMQELLGREESYEVTLEEEAPVPFPGQDEMGWSWLVPGRKLRFPSRHLDGSLRLLAREGARVAEVKPVRLSLEEFFLRHVEEGEKAG
jgi:ABC-2 type transport system ATP-binding protein